MSCGTRIVRGFLFASNILVWIMGVALFALGVYIFLDGKDYSELLDGGLFSVSVVILTVGFLITLIGFLGCCGAIKKNSCMLLVYAIFMSIIIAIQLTGAVIAFLFKSDAKQYVKRGITESLAVYGGRSNEFDAYTKALDFAQVSFKCCGMNSNQDYSNASLAIKWTEAGNSSNVPVSCCIRQRVDCGDGESNSITSSSVHTKGCLLELEEFISGNLQLIGVVAAVFVVVEVLNLSLSFWLWVRYK